LLLYHLFSQQLDLLSDEIMIDCLVKSGTCAVLVSEEQEEPIIPPPEQRGSLCCAFDPLDGSSNIDCNGNHDIIISPSLQPLHLKKYRR
jgi:fructose-1,6-bisphosphatase I